jgi:GMP synthase-like glutamine amidotransferase
MRLGILEAGRPPAPLDEKHGLYPAMFTDLLRPHLPETAEITSFSVIDGDFPDSVVDRDAWLITGGANGAYDPDPFIARLHDFARAAAEAEAPMIGICLGHQIIANALGGKAEKSDRGWGVGVHVYRVQETRDWMDVPVGGAFSTYVSHQDQITAPPPGATVLASSDFCPYAMLEVSERILTLQSHPEMPSAYVRDLYDARRPRIGDERVDEALAGLSDGPRAQDADRVAAWIGAFLNRALEAR